MPHLNRKPASCERDFTRLFSSLAEDNSIYGTNIVQLNKGRRERKKGV